jgi:hypothetical protein
MAPRASKAKSTAEKGTPQAPIMAPGRQRTLSTKQQLLRKSLLLLPASQSNFLFI